VTDAGPGGERIAELLASEVEGRTDGSLGRLAVTDADEVPDDPPPDGALAYRIAVDVGGSGASDRSADHDGSPLADVLVHADRVRLAGLDASGAARGAGLPTRREGGRVVATVGSGAAVKRALDAVREAAGSIERR